LIGQKVIWQGYYLPNENLVSTPVKSAKTLWNLRIFSRSDCHLTRSSRLRTKGG